MIELSVIIPCHNAESTISELLQHLETQTLGREKYEVIVVDDGSVDRTPKMVKEFERAQLITQSNMGPGAARMKGITAARGKYALFLDSDLDVRSDLLEKHLTYHQLHPQIAATGGSVVPANEPGLFSWALVDHLSSWFNAHPGVRYSKPPEYLPSLNFCVNKEVVFDQHDIKWADGLAHTGEDVIFCYHMRRKGLEIAFLADAPVIHSDRSNFRGHLHHMYRWGYHAPFVRGHFPHLRYGFLFPPQMFLQFLMLPAIVLSYTLYVWKSWLDSRTLQATLSLPQIMIGRIAYAAGVWKGAKDKRGKQRQASVFVDRINL